MNEKCIKISEKYSIFESSIKIYEYLEKTEFHCNILWKYYHNDKLSNEEITILNELPNSYKLELMKYLGFRNYIDKQYKFNDPVCKKDYQRLANRQKVKTRLEHLQLHLLSDTNRRKIIDIINKLLVENIEEKIISTRNNYQVSKCHIAAKVRKNNNELIRFCQEEPNNLYEEYLNIDEYTQKMLLGYAMFCWYETIPIDLEQASLIAHSTDEEKITAMDFFAFPTQTKQQVSNLSRKLKKDNY